MATFADALRAGLFFIGGACTDCTIALVNGEAPEDNSEWDEPKYLRTCDEYDITPGHVHTGGYYSEIRCHHAGTECKPECECERHDFQTAPCAICESPLHGTRHDFILIRRNVLADDYTVPAYLTDQEK